MLQEKPNRSGRWLRRIGGIAIECLPEFRIDVSKSQWMLLVFWNFKRKYSS
jgi:hypothetical protein